jgi:hypothetical protein
MQRGTGAATLSAARGQPPRQATQPRVSHVFRGCCALTDDHGCGAHQQKRHGRRVRHPAPPKLIRAASVQRGYRMQAPLGLSWRKTVGQPRPLALSCGLRVAHEEWREGAVSVTPAGAVHVMISPRVGPPDSLTGFPPCPHLLRRRLPLPPRRQPLPPPHPSPPPAPCHAAPNKGSTRRHSCAAPVAAYTATPPRRRLAAPPAPPLPPPPAPPQRVRARVSAAAASSAARVRAWARLAGRQAVGVCCCCLGVGELSGQGRDLAQVGGGGQHVLGGGGGGGRLCLKGMCALDWRGACCPTRRRASCPPPSPAVAASLRCLLNSRCEKLLTTPSGPVLGPVTGHARPNTRSRGYRLVVRV